MRGPMKLIDLHTGHMQCRVCGSEHYASVKPGSGGKFHRGSWQCVNKCAPSSSREALARGLPAALHRFDRVAAQVGTTEN